MQVLGTLPKSDAQIIIPPKKNQFHKALFIQDHTHAIHESVDKLKENSKNMNEKLKRMERMMEKLLKASHINEFDDDDDD